MVGSSLADNILNGVSNGSYDSAEEGGNDGSGGDDSGEEEAPLPADGEVDEPASEDAVSEDAGSDGEMYDIGLAASHSYMSAGMVSVAGRCVLEPGWRGRVPVVSHHGCVFPGETVPMLLPDANDAALLMETLKRDRLFGLLCPDETSSILSGFGVLCEVFEAGIAEEEPTSLTFKARANHRFKLTPMPDRPVPLSAFNRMRYVEVTVLPEIARCDALSAARLYSLDPLRTPRSLSSRGRDRRVRRLDAAVTPWPHFVYDMFDYTRMRHSLQEHFKTIMLDKLPEEPVSLSFWVASNLALSARDRLALFMENSALLRLHMECRFIKRKSLLCCSSCLSEIARREHIIPMSSEGVHSNYVNLGGFVHDLLTVSESVNIVLNGTPTAEYSWFPGYAWTIATCINCGVHVGWRFGALRRTLRPQHFYGLCRNYIQPYSQRQAEAEDDWAEAELATADLDEPAMDVA